MTDREPSSAPDAQSQGTKGAQRKPQTQKRDKFILFVGNLTFDTTEKELAEFFKKVYPVSIRLLTNKATGKSKGFAFVEFDSSAHLHKALAMDKAEMRGRKINVELTAGGGGSKSKVRRERIKTKNEELRKEKSKKMARESAKEEANQ